MSYGLPIGKYVGMLLLETNWFTSHEYSCIPPSVEGINYSSLIENPNNIQIHIGTHWMIVHVCKFQMAAPL